MNPQKNTIFCGGNLEVVASWPSNIISAIVTDPPYGIGFMGKTWDTYSDKSLKHYHKDHSFAGNQRPKEKSAFTTRATAAGSYDFSPQGQINFYNWMLDWAKAMLRITKPGGFLLCFGGTRTYHRLACAIEDAGWEIRDCMMWLYGSGFPKSHNISKAIDKAAGAKREIVGQYDHRSIQDGADRVSNGDTGKSQCAGRSSKVNITTPATSLAETWDGYGTALKPAWEPIIVAMKLLDGTFAHNAETHGVAGLNIDAARIGTEKRYNQKAGNPTDRDTAAFRAIPNPHNYQGKEVQGRWPANLLLDEEVAEGESWKRYFYCAKTSRKERNIGLDDSSGKKVNDGRQTPIDNPYQRGETIRRNTHPTVKPLALMKYLCTLLRMPSADQIILDPFLGSGTTGIACKELGINFIGIEKEAEYCEIAIKRIAAIGGQEITLHTKTPSPQQIPLPVIKNESFVSESRQRIINAAVAALREKRK